MSNREDFDELFLKLDGGGANDYQPEVTEACVEALFDRVVNPPMLNGVRPTLEDVDDAEWKLIEMIRTAAAKTRELIASRSE